MKIIISGGTGFIGTALTKRLLAEGHKVILLTRNPGAVGISHPDLKSIQWDGATRGAWVNDVSGSDVIINLAGESIAGGRWTKAQKERLIKSRMQATNILGQAIIESKPKPKVFISASAVGYYGNVESGNVTEDHEKGSDFLAGLCARWEEESRRVENAGVRVVNPRIGIVLEKNGGALQRLIIPFKFFAGSWLGSGEQWFPWVHRDDVIGILLYAMEHEGVSGAVNTSSPSPVTMKEFCKTLGIVMKRPCFMGVPSFVLKLGLGEMSEMLLTGQKTIPLKIEQAGYKFLFPDLEGALRNILEKNTN